MNKGQKIVAGLLGVVAAELAVIDYAVIEYMRNGAQVEISVEELGAARELVESEMEEDGETMLEEVAE